MTAGNTSPEEALAGIRALSADEVEAARSRVIDLWSNGMDAEDIAAAVGLHEAWCRRVVMRHRSGQLSAGMKQEAGR